MIRSKLMPWYIAQAIKASVSPAIAVLNWHADFWSAWHEVWRAPR